ncbi:MAG: TolC family protein [Alloprevotella tannerae]|nr:TolC family protein [Alloprevotella tannerae]
MRRRIVFCLLFIVGFGVSLMAQRVLSLDSCRALALRNNKDLAISRTNRDVALNTHNAARTNYLPKVTVQAAYVRTGKELSVLNKDQKNALSNMGTHLSEAFSGTFGQIAQGIIARHPDLAPLVQQLGGVGQAFAGALNQTGRGIADAFRTDSRNLVVGNILLTQPLYMGGKIRAYDRLTHYVQDVADQQLRVDEQNLILETDRAYWQTVSLSNKLKLARSYRDMLTHLDQDVTKMIDAGVATKANQLQVSVKLNEADMMVTKVEDGLTLSRMLLCQLCGLPPGENIETADENRDDLAVGGTVVKVDEQTAYENRPELCQLQSAINIAQEKVNIVRSDYLPHLALMGGYTVMNPAMYNGFEKKFRGDWSVGVTLSVPVWNWGEGRYKIKAAKAEAQIATLRAEEVREKIGLQVNQEMFRVKETNKQLRLAEKNLEKANENLRVATLGYKEGVINTTDVLAAETAWLQAQSDRIDAEIDSMMTSSALQKALGILSVQ